MYEDLHVGRNLDNFIRSLIRRLSLPRELPRKTY